MKARGDRDAAMGELDEVGEGEDGEEEGGWGTGEGEDGEEGG